jgi:pyruvate dehydrogenase E1 component alpha subunit
LLIGSIPFSCFHTALTSVKDISISSTPCSTSHVVSLTFSVRCGYLFIEFHTKRKLVKSGCVAGTTFDESERQKGMIMPTKVIQKFSISYMQILDEDGTIDEKLDPKLSKDDLLKLYRIMLLARRTDERMLKLQRQGRLGTLPVCVGQEAVSAAAALALEKDDWMVTAYRELAGRLMRGEKPLNPMLVYAGFEEGNVIKDNNRVLPVAIILGSQVPHAVGIAYAEKVKGTKNAVLAFYGDGASSQGDIHEAINFAAVWKAPVVFLNQNNHWAISTPLNKQMANETLAQRSIAYGIPGIQVDGNDALAVYRATKEALDRARKGEGPSLIEANTYRMLMHTTADDPKKYRSQEEVEEWVKRDPITRFKIYLEKKKFWDDKKNEKLEEELKAEIDEAVTQFESYTDFKLDEPFETTFGSEVAPLVEQHREFLADLQKDQNNA